MLITRWPRALEEEGVRRRLLKQVLPFERRRCSKLLWQSCGHQDVDWEGCAKEGKAVCTQQGQQFLFRTLFPTTHFQNHLQEGKVGRDRETTNWD